MSDSHAHDEMTERQVDAYHLRFRKWADRGEYWYIWLIVGGLSGYFAYKVWDVRGLIVWLIIAIATFLVSWVEIESGWFTLVVLLVAAGVIIVFSLFAWSHL